jgi:hypothetical protein
VAATDKRDASFLEVSGNCDANAAFIVRACNNAERLAEALKRIETAHHTEIRRIAREALAQWEAK